MPKFKKLSIIIVNYQSKAYLQECLASLFRFNLGIDFEVVLVNNDQEEKLDELAARSAEVILINSPENKGFGAACNLGVKYSEGDLLFFLNPDTEIQSDLGRIIEIWEKNSELGALGPRLLGEDGKTQEWSTGVEISLLELIRNNLGLSRSQRIWKSFMPQETFWISGAALFVPRKIFFEIGGFDENFFMYFEDNDLCRRIRQAGRKLLYLPEVAILHRGGKSCQNSKKQKRIFFASQDYYFQKHFGNWQVFWLKILRRIFYGNKF